MVHLGVFMVCVAVVQDHACVCEHMHPYGTLLKLEQAIKCLFTSFP